MRELLIVLLLVLSGPACTGNAPDTSGSAAGESSRGRPPLKPYPEKDGLLLLQLEVLLLADDLRIFESLEARRRPGEIICTKRIYAHLLQQTREFEDSIPEAKRKLGTPEARTWFVAEVEGPFSEVAERVRKIVRAK